MGLRLARVGCLLAVGLCKVACERLVRVRRPSLRYATHHARKFVNVGRHMCVLGAGAIVLTPKPTCRRCSCKTVQRLRHGAPTTVFVARAGRAVRECLLSTCTAQSKRPSRLLRQICAAFRVQAKVPRRPHACDNLRIVRIQILLQCVTRFQRHVEAWSCERRTACPADHWESKYMIGQKHVVRLASYKADLANEGHVAFRQWRAQPSMGLRENHLAVGPCRAGEGP